MVTNCLEQQLPIDAVKIALDVNIEHPVEELSPNFGDGVTDQAAA